MSAPTRYLTHDGLTLPFREWAARARIPHETLRKRLDDLGWDVARALSTPVNPARRKGGKPKADAPRPCPKPRRNGATAFVRYKINGRDHYHTLGPWGSDEAAAAYRRFAAGWLEDPGTALPHPDGPLVADLASAFLTWAKSEYVKDGTPTSELGLVGRAVRPLVDLYGDTPAAGFTPDRFRHVRTAMVQKGWCRKTVNAQSDRVRRAFGWAAGRGLIPPTVPAALKFVEPIRAGKGVPDRPGPRPAVDADVEAALTFMSPPIRAAVLFQRLTGCRPNEACAARPCDLDRSGAVWVYVVPGRVDKQLHKTGGGKRYYLGPRCQALLTPLLADADPEATLFCPSRVYYARAVGVACRKAGVTRWTPHALRRAFATEVARRFESLDAAAAGIGDHARTAAAHYVFADPNEATRRRIAKEMG